MPVSHLEDVYRAALMEAGILMPDKTNYNPLYAEGRHDIRQQFDFAWTGLKLLVEINGATHINGRHVQPEGYKSDHEKYNRAALAGWCVLVFTEDHVQKSRYAGYAVEQTALAIKTLRARMAERVG